MTTKNVTNKSNAGAKGALSKTQIATLSKAPGACGGRGARTILIENFIRAAGAKGATVRQLEDALAPHNVKCIRNHVATLYSKQLLSKSASAPFVYSIKSAKTTKKTKKTTKAPTTTTTTNDKGAE